MKKNCSHWQSGEEWFLMCCEFRTWNALPESMAESASNQDCQRGKGLAPEEKGFAGL